MNKKSVTQFKQFLIAEGIKENYLAMVRQRAERDKRVINEKFYLHAFMLRQNCGSWIDAVMVWHETKEGYKFWKEKDKKWLDIRHN